MKIESFVDVIMPNYNKGDYIEEAVNSVISQEYKNWKLFIIDNCSTDNSISVLKKIENTSNQIFVIYLSKNKSAAFSRNLGMRMSKSKYISFMDSDDYWSSKKLINQINLMEEKKYLFTYTNYTPFLYKKKRKIYKKEINAPNSFTFEKFINNTTIATTSMIINRSAIGNLKFPKIESFEDYSFKCKILKKINIANKCNDNSTFYRILRNSLSSSKIKSLYWLWVINKKHNKLPFFKNLKSLILISINSIKKYGYK